MHCLSSPRKYLVILCSLIILLGIVVFPLQHTNVVNAQAPEVSLHQWATTATASSEYGGGWAASEATGAPDVYPYCGDEYGAWASASSNTIDWLEVSFTTPVYPTQVNIYQTYNPDVITEIELFFTAGGSYVIPVTPSAPYVDCPAQIFSQDIPAGFGLVDRVRITVDQTLSGNWSEIDAVELVGMDTPPAVQALVPSGFDPGDARLNQSQGDAGQPVAIYQGSVDVYGIDPVTSQGVLEVRVTDEQIEAVGVPSADEWSRLLARGENRATGMPIEVYRLATGEFQVNTYYASGKPYIFRWHPDRPDEGVHVAW